MIGIFTDKVDYFQVKTKKKILYPSRLWINILVFQTRRMFVEPLRVRQFEAVVVSRLRPCQLFRDVVISKVILDLFDWSFLNEKKGFRKKGNNLM